MIYQRYSSLYLFSGQNISLHIFKTIENEMILSLAKHLNEKMREQLVKICKERKRHVSDFSTLSIDDMKTGKTKVSV